MWGLRVGISSILDIEFRNNLIGCFLSAHEMLYFEKFSEKLQYFPVFQSKTKSMNIISTLERFIREQRNNISYVKNQSKIYRLR